jgi:hypothetical protein
MSRHCFMSSLNTDSPQDTPTIGAGFWAEQWVDENPFDRPRGMMYQRSTLSPAAKLVNGDFSSVLQECLPSVSSYLPLSPREEVVSKHSVNSLSAPHGVALSGTGNITRHVTNFPIWLTSFRQWRFVPQNICSSYHVCDDSLLLPASSSRSVCIACGWT